MKNFFLLPILLFVILLGCTQTKDLELISNSNKGGYTVRFPDTSNFTEDSIYVTGTVYDIESKLPLQASIITYYCSKITSNESGKYQLTIPKASSLDYLFKATSLGYKGVITESIKIPSESLQLDFYLQLDTAPIIHCPDNLPSD